jgi:hypothetical protein
MAPGSKLTAQDYDGTLQVEPFPAVIKGKQTKMLNDTKPAEQRH